MILEKMRMQLSLTCLIVEVLDTMGKWGLTLTVKTITKQLIGFYCIFATWLWCSFGIWEMQLAQHSLFFLHNNASYVPIRPIYLPPFLLEGETKRGQYIGEEY